MFKFPPQSKLENPTKMVYQHGVGRLGKYQSITLAFILLLLNGCVVGPNFTPPTVPAFQQDYSVLSFDDQSAPIHVWLGSFADSKLVHLLTTADGQNLDVQQAYYRIVEARANAGVVRGELAPTGDVVSEYSFRQQSANASPFVGSNGEPFNFFLEGFESTWQIDLFGKIARAIESAEAQVSFSEFDAEFIRRALLSDVAATYVRIRLLQDQIVLVDRNLRIQTQTENLVGDRQNAGVSTELDTLQTRALIERTNSIKSALQQDLNVEMNGLSVLLGQVPTPELREFLSDVTVLDIPPILELGFPANLLRERADVRRDEWAFASAMAEIGVAEADLYPQLTLIGDISVSAQSVSTLFSTASLAFDVGPSLRWNIIHFGRITNNIEAAKARCQQAHLTYQQTVLSAVREVEDSVARFNGLRDQAESLGRAIDADEKAVDLSLERYRAGRANFQRVLDAQEQLLQDLQQRSSTRYQAIEQLVRLYNALGGNWQQLAVQANAYHEQGQADPFIWSSSDPSFHPDAAIEQPVLRTEPSAVPAEGSTRPPSPSFGHEPGVVFPAPKSLDLGQIDSSLY